MDKDSARRGRISAKGRGFPSRAEDSARRQGLFGKRNKNSILLYVIIVLQVVIIPIVIGIPIYFSIFIFFIVRSNLSGN